MKRRASVLLIAGAVALVVSAIWFGYAFDWDWTGLRSSPKSDTIQPAKTVWDWLQLLIIPAALGLGTLWFNAQQSQRQQRLSDQQHAADQLRADGQYKAEQELAEQRRKTDLELAQDQQRETTLQVYLDRMTELLLEKQLRGSQEGDEIRQVARARTLTVLRRLDPERKTSLFRFLSEAHLVGSEYNIIDLSGADLSGADLSNSDLSEAKLSFADLFNANLRGANLRRAVLFKADLRGADLLGADLRGAKLYLATLSGAKLIGADLGEALQLHILGDRGR